MSTPPYNSQPPTPPGWYADGSGNQRYWDGTQWTGQTAPLGDPSANAQAFGGSDDTTMATIVHIAALVSWFLGPLVIYLVRGKDSSFVRHHVVEALNFGITMSIAATVSGILLFVLVGFLLLPIVVVLGFVYPIIAAIAASKGEWYRYPLTLRLIPGAR